MVANKSQQIVFDVFNREGGEEKRPYSYLSAFKSDGASEGPAINVILTPQVAIVFLICIILFLIGSFSLGFEKGRLITKNGQGLTKPPPTIQVTSAARTPETPLVLPQAKTVVKPQAQTAAQIKKKSTAPKGAYTIQVASLKSKKSAEGLSETLSQKGLYSFVKPSGKYLVVLAGNFKKREEARLAWKELRKTFNDCFIRKI